MIKLRKLLGFVAVLGLLVPASWISAQETARRANRGISIGETGLTAQDLFGAAIRWDKQDLRNGGENALSVSLVSMTGAEGIPVFRRRVTASAKRPNRKHVFSLNLRQRRLVEKSDKLGVATTQKVQLRGGLYRRAWVAHSGSFPNVVGSKVHTLSACIPLQAGGTYSGCYYGYTSLSNMDLNTATFLDAQFPFATLKGTNFTKANLSYATLSYANLTNATLTNANLSFADLSGANLTGAVLTGATLTNAQYCNTIMPDGTTKNTNC